MSAPLAVRLDDTILSWLLYAALIVGRYVFGALCSQLKFTRPVKFNYKLIMINNKHSCAWNWKKFHSSSGMLSGKTYTRKLECCLASTGTLSWFLLSSPLVHSICVSPVIKVLCIIVWKESVILICYIAVHVFIRVYLMCGIQFISSIYIFLLIKLNTEDQIKIIIGLLQQPLLKWPTRNHI